jgi:hypothetical protein
MNILNSLLMKRLFALSMIMLVLVAAVSAQGPGDRYRRHSVRSGIRSGELSRMESLELRKNKIRINSLQRRAHRDGIVTPYERRKIYKAKANNRRETFRFKHNRVHRHHRMR